jgi:hypothetical protein
VLATTRKNRIGWSYISKSLEAWNAMMNILKAIGLTLLCATLFVATATPAAAQGSRKDDVVFGPTGRPMAGASVAICTEPATTTAAPCSPLASLYSDSALTQPLANPLSTDGLGNYFFYAAPGKYTIQIYGPGITTRVLPDVILPSDPSAPTFTSVTTTSGISAFSLSLAGNLAVSGSTAVAGTLTVGGSPIPTAGEANMWTANQSFKGPIPYWDVTAWGASGSNATATGSSISLSTPTTITLGSAQDFANGEGVMVPGAGPTSSLSTPAGVAAVAVGATGTTSHTYKVVACDTARGCSAAASVTLTNANATLTLANYVQGAISPVVNAAFYAVYKDGAPWGTFTAELSPAYTISAISNTTGTTTATVNQNCAECNYAIVGSQIVVSGASVTAYNGTWTVTAVPAVNEIQWAQSGSPASGTNGSIAQPIKWLDRGAGAVASQYWPLNVPTTPPSSPTNQWYIGQITAGAGTTALTVTPAATAAVSGATAYHDDTAAINGAAAACAAQRSSLTQGGAVYAPSGWYNAFGVLNFPFIGTYGMTCNFQLIGLLQIANTVSPAKGWNFQGLGGWEQVQFQHGSVAGIENLDAGALPTILLNNAGSGQFKNLVVGGYAANGSAIEVSGQGGVNFESVGAFNATTSYGPSLKFRDACCWDYTDDGEFNGNGIDDAIWLEGTGSTTPSNQVQMNRTELLSGGIKIFSETNSLGPNANTFQFNFVTSEGQKSSLYDFDTRNTAIDLVTIADGGMYDDTGSPTLIDIVAYIQSITSVTINNATVSGAAYIGSSASGPPCIDGLNILNGHPGTAITSGTVCNEYESFDGTNGLVFTGLPVNLSAASSLKVPPHVLQGAANADLAGTSACASGAKTITFADAYSSTPVILIFDETTHGGASITAKSASSFTVACTGASDAFDYLVIGNPN